MPEKAPKPIGLSPKDHGFLNGLNLLPIEERRKIYAEKRSLYAGDKVALQQIDVYDGDTLYHTQLRKFTDALKSGDTKTEAELQAWFDENYPDIK